MPNILPVYMALDCSGSMAGEPIRTMQESVSGLLQNLQENSTDDSEVWVSIVSFNHEVDEIRPLQPVTTTTCPELIAEGGTRIGPALDFISRGASRDLTPDRQWLDPEIVVMTDGDASDDWRPAADRLRATAGYVIGVGIGPHADTNMLSEFASTVAHIPRQDAELIRETFNWMGGVIRAAATEGENRVFPQPPSSVRLAPGEGRRREHSQRWGDRPLGASPEDDEAARQRAEARRQREAELRRQEEERRRREEEERREREEAQERRRQEERQRLDDMAAAVDELRDDVDEPLREQTPSALQFAQTVAASSFDEHTELREARPPESLEDLAQRCGLWLMSLSLSKTPLAERRSALLDDLEQLVSKLRLHDRPATRHHATIRSIESDISAMRDAQPTNDEQITSTELRRLGMAVLNVASLEAHRETGSELDTAEEILRLLSTDRGQATRLLQGTKTPKFFGDSAAHRIVALRLLEAAAHEIGQSRDTDLSSLLLALAESFARSFPDLLARSDALQVAIEACAARKFVTDEVDVTAFSPPEVESGRCCLVQVLLHQPQDAKAAKRMAEAADTDSLRRGHKSLSIPIKRGDSLTIRLHSDRLEVEPKTQRISWTGSPQNAQFLVKAKPEVPLGRELLKVVVLQRSIPVGTIHFAIKVVGQPTGNELRPTGENACRFRRAFISYATVDRREVVLQTRLLPHLGIDIFIDFLTLDPGERWKREIYKHIDDCDLFLLFWSEASKHSKWVRKESNYALERQRETELPEIFPVVLPPPPPPLPWEELEELHFGDSILYYSFLEPE